MNKERDLQMVFGPSQLSNILLLQLEYFYYPMKGKFHGIIWVRVIHTATAPLDSRGFFICGTK